MLKVLRLYLPFLVKVLFTIFILAKLLDFVGLIVIEPTLLLVYLLGGLLITGSLFSKEILTKIREYWRTSVALTLFWSFSLLYVVIFVLIQNGSPFVYESGNMQSKQLIFNELSVTNAQSGIYTAPTNNLGSVKLAFRPLSIPLDEIPIDAVETIETNTTQTVRITIAENNQPIFYSAELTLDWIDESVFFYEFGFPIQEDSKGKTYKVEISPAADNHPRDNSLQVGTTSNKTVIDGKHVIPLSTAFNKLGDSFDILKLKTKAVPNSEFSNLLYLVVVISCVVVWLRTRPHSSNWIGSYAIPITVLLVVGLEYLSTLLDIKLLSGKTSLVVTFLLILLLIGIFAFLWFHRKQLTQHIQQPTLRSNTGFKYLEAIIISVLLLSGLWLRFDQLGKEALYHDELTQYQALLGLKNTGILGTYNPFTEQIIQPYPRAALLTYSSHWLTEWFGFNEGVIRAPAAISGWMLLVVMYLIARKLFGRVAGLTALLLATFNPYLIYFSRFFRNYSPLILWYLLSVGIICLWLKNELDEHKNMSPRIRVLYATATSIAFLFSYHFGVVQALTLLPIFGLAWLYFVMQRAQSFKSAVRYIIPLLVGAILLLILYFLGLFKIDGFLYLLTRHLDISLKQTDSVQVYYNYLFSFNFRFLISMILAFSTLSFLLVKKWMALPAVTTALIFILVAVLGNRYEDFRYISFAMPIAILAISAGVELIVRFLNSLKQTRLTQVAKLAFVCTVFLIPTYPLRVSLVSNNTGYKFAPAQSSRTIAEQSRIIHRRAVAPDYKTVFSYLNTHATDTDVFIFTGSDYVYLELVPNEAYFLNRGTTELVSLTGKSESVQLNKLIQDSTCKKIWFIGTYLHLLSNDVVELIEPDGENQFQNVGTEIMIPSYNYNHWYQTHEFTWPTLLAKDSDCSQ